MSWTTDPQAIRSRRQELYSLLGDLPHPNVETDRGPVDAQLVDRTEREHYVLETLLLDLGRDRPVPAYCTLPKDAGEGPFPAILFNHSHGGRYELGKDELIHGNTYMSRPPYAEALARAGIAALAIDALTFGERRGMSESELFKELLWRGKVLWGEMVYDSLRAFDYLSRRPDIDPSRIGTLGMSMGSTMSWWVAALETRIKVCIDICCLSDFDALIETRYLDGHGIYYYVPSLLKHFNAGEIHALIAPRPHLSLAGNLDRFTPPKGMDRIDAFLKEVYRTWHAPDAWQLIRYDVGHVETAAMRRHALDFLAKHL